MANSSSVNRSVVLGLSAFHGDSSAALIVDGVLVAAAEEERFSRVKHSAAFPRAAIAYCLRHAGLAPSQVTDVALPGMPGGHLAERLSVAVRAPRLALTKLMNKLGGDKGNRLTECLRDAGLEQARVRHFEHHLAHMASVRPLGGSDDMLLVTLDGLGDFVSASCGSAQGDAMQILERVFFPNSLGFFYTALTHHAGFHKFGEEFKVMGLASYGAPTYVDKIRRLIETKPGFAFELNKSAFPILKNGVPFKVENDQPRVEQFHDDAVVAKITGLPPRHPDEPLDQRHSDFAHSLQVRFEEIADHLITAAARRFPSKNIGLAGGCAHNSVWVGKVMARHGFKNVHVAPASHDAGLAVGAAVLAFGGAVRCAEPHWALLGPSHDAIPSTESVADFGTARTFATDEELQKFLAAEIDAGKIIGLMHGRMEFGPRALGSRSILCDPRPAAMRDRLNARVKHREHFRPFAAAVLWEQQSEWFEGGFFSPAMEAVFAVKPAKRDQIAAVVHADNSCRLQSIERNAQPFLWGLIRAFHERTGVPMLVNTSFNDSEPIVCTPHDAIECFRRTEMDHIVIGRTLLTRCAGSARRAG